MNTETQTQHLAAQIQSNEIWAVLYPKKEARLLKANRAMMKEIEQLNPVAPEIEAMTDEELLEELNS